MLNWRLPDQCEQLLQAALESDWESFRFKQKKWNWSKNVTMQQSAQKVEFVLRVHHRLWVQQGKHYVKYAGGHNLERSFSSQASTLFNIQRYKNKAMLSTADSLNVAPINSDSLTCAERRFEGSSETDRPPSAQQQGSPLTERATAEEASKSTKKPRQNKNLWLPNTGGATTKQSRRFMCSLVYLICSTFHHSVDVLHRRPLWAAQLNE